MENGYKRLRGSSFLRPRVTLHGEPRYPCPMVWSPPCAPRIAVFSDVAGEEEKEPEPSAAATTRDAVTGLEDAAISGEALEAVAASRRRMSKPGSDAARLGFVWLINFPARGLHLNT